MKKIMTCVGAILFASVIFSGCSSASSEKKEGAVEENEKLSADSLTNKSVAMPAPEKLEPADVTPKMYFRTLDMSGYEGFEDSKPETGEREDFRKRKKYTFCYDSEEFNKFQITGKGKQLSLEVKDGNKNIFSKDNFDLDGQMVFTTKDFDFAMGSTYLITLRQNETIVFEGKIDSQGCM